MAKPTSCRDAIKRWEEITGQVAAEAKEVSLICQIPFIDKMDDSLNQLEQCEKLSLSTNQIERVLPLPKLKNLKILSLARNNIKRITGLDEIGQSLEQLWISYNQIEKLEGLNGCVKLTTLFISNNRIKVWDELTKLANSENFQTILLVENPIYGTNDFDAVAPRVVKRIPQLQYLDSKQITGPIRKAAEEAD